MSRREARALWAGGACSVERYKRKGDRLRRWPRGAHREHTVDLVRGSPTRPIAFPTPTLFAGSCKTPLCAALVDVSGLVGFLLDEDDRRHWRPLNAASGSRQGAPTGGLAPTHTDYLPRPSPSCRACRDGGLRSRPDTLTDAHVERADVSRVVRRDRSDCKGDLSHRRVKEAVQRH